MQREFDSVGTTSEEMASIVSILFVAKGVVNDVQKKALLFHTAGMEVQEMYETLTDLGTDTFGEDTATE